MSAIELTGHGAVYVRISDDDQDADRQRKSTSEWITRNGCDDRSVTVYEDLGWKRHQADQRPRFQRMLRDAEDGLVQWIVCDALDRFGTKNKNQLLAYLYRLQEAGCKLFTVNDKEWTGTDLLTLIEAGMEGEKSEKELRDKSERVLDAMRVMASKGTWLGGRVPYGFDVVAFRMEKNGRMAEQWRVQIIGPQSRLKIDTRGGERTYDGKNNFPATEQDEILQLRPTQGETKLDVIRNIFDRFSTEAINFNQLATQLDSQGVPPPAYASSWKFFHLREVLSNPAYIGMPGWNRRTHGHYTQWKDGRRHSKRPGSGMQRNARQDWITPNEVMFPPIVDPEIFLKVQAKLALMPVKKKSPKSAKMWLAGLIHCANCGKAMCGKTDTRSGKPQYICSTYVNARGPRKNCGCLCNIVSHDLIEEKLRTYLAEAGIQLLDIIGGVKKAMVGQPMGLKQAIQRAVEAHRKMRELVGAAFARLTAEMTGETSCVVLELPDVEMGKGSVTFASEWDTDRLEQLYRHSFDDGKTDWEAKLDELQFKQDELIDSLAKIPATASRALGRIQAQIDQIDSEIRETEEKLENAADAFQQANDQYDRFSKEWQDAQSAVETEASARRKAEAVRKVIAKINLRFRPTGKKRPVSELLAIEWIPTGADEISPLSRSSPLPRGKRYSSALDSSRGPGCRSR